MPKVVLDTSALVALLDGGDNAEDIMKSMEEGAVISAVNLAELEGMLVNKNVPPNIIDNIVSALRLEVAPFDIEEVRALDSVEFRGFKPEVGDLACLALALRRGLPLLTLDTDFSKLSNLVEVKVIPYKPHQPPKN